MSVVAIEMVDLSPADDLGEPDVVKPRVEEAHEPHSDPSVSESDTQSGVDVTFDWVALFHWETAAQNPNSLFLFPPTSSLRLWCQQLEQNIIFRWLILFSVLVRNVNQSRPQL
jgi:hypothetical protein